MVQRKPPPRRPAGGSALVDHANEILIILGRVEEGLYRLRLDFEEEKNDTKDSRGRMHTKLEKIEVDVGIVGQVAAQAREEATELKRIIDEDVKPATDDYKRVRAIGKGTLWAVGLAAGGAGITIATVGDTVINWLRAVLRIP